MELAGEMMDDTMESALDNDEVEEETNELVDQVGGWVVVVHVVVVCVCVRGMHKAGGAGEGWVVVVWVWLARVVWGLGGL